MKKQDSMVLRWQQAMEGYAAAYNKITFCKMVASFLQADGAISVQQVK